MEAQRELMTTRLEDWVWCLLNLRLRWADLRSIDGGLVERRCGWIFVAPTTLFFLFFVMVAAGGVGVMGGAWWRKAFNCFPDLLHPFARFFFVREEF
jgi:hypothetical protein